MSAAAAGTTATAGTNAVGGTAASPAVGGMSAVGGAAVACDAPLSSGPLPESLKGYELYVWQDGDELTFVVVTGTNREKTLEEIQAVERRPLSSTYDGYVSQRGVGLEELKYMVCKVPASATLVEVSLAGLPALDAALRTEVERVLGTRR